MSLFDRKFGANFLASVPLDSGVYRYYDESGKVIYVGKAKQLRRRLSQYRLATKQRTHRRMRKILSAAHSVDYTVCPSHLDACLLEIKLIQELRPSCNIVGTYSHLYPYVGIQSHGVTLSFVFSSRPDTLDGYVLFGAFRSRAVVGAAFFSLMKLLTYVGHRSQPKRPATAVPRKNVYEFSFHQIPPDWAGMWADFFKGQSRGALETLTLYLLENVGARSRSTELQEKINALRLFWEEEAIPLAQAIVQTEYESHYPVPQAERDPLFLRSRLRD